MVDFTFRLYRIIFLQTEQLKGEKYGCCFFTLFYSKKKTRKKVRENIFYLFFFLQRKKIGWRNRRKREKKNAKKHLTFERYTTRGKNQCDTIYQNTGCNKETFEGYENFSEGKMEKKLFRIVRRGNSELKCFLKRKFKRW